MIRLNKGAVPQVLALHQEEWTIELRRRLATGDDPGPAYRRYNQPEIKQALKDETGNKCAYCEAKVGIVDYPHIEHIAPKSIVPDRCFDWSNLTLACGICNNHKLDYFDPSDPPIDPYSVDPTVHIRFVQCVAFAENGSRLGSRSIKLLALNRAELFIARSEHCLKLGGLVEQWLMESDPQMKLAIARELRERANPDKEFSALVVTMLDELGVP